MKRLSLPILLIVSVVCAFGQGTEEERASRIGRISKLSATTNGDRGTFSVSSVDTLNPGQFSGGLGWDNFDRTPDDLDINVAAIFVSYGITDRITVTGTLEAQKQIAARNLPQTGFFNSLPFVHTRYESGVGDAFLRVKYRIQRRADNVGGISLSSFLKLPNAEVDRGLGTGGVDAGLELAFTSLLPLNFVLHSTSALVATSDVETPSPLGIQDELRSGIGVAWPATGIRIPRGILQGIFEYSNTSFIGAGSPNDAIQAPTELTFGARYLDLDRGLAFSAGYRRNTNFDEAFPGNEEANGFTFGVTYTQPVEGVSLNSFPVVLLDADTDLIAVGDALPITARAFDADNEALTYAWTSTGGEIAGTGESVTFNSAGLAPGAYVVRVVVTDQRGGAAQAQLTVTVE